MDCEDAKKQKEREREREGERKRESSSRHLLTAYVYQEQRMVESDSVRRRHDDTVTTVDDGDRSRYGPSVTVLSASDTYSCSFVR